MQYLEPNGVKKILIGTNWPPPLFSAEILGSTVSPLEHELDRIRSYRDTLYSGELSWREAVKLIQSASVFTKAGLDSWDSLGSTL